MKFIIACFVGAIIGYITNWLAIKMLFRPHKEIRIGNMKVPFTPGLIPKERGRIAKSVGETIGKHLLTTDTIVSSLCSDSMNLQLENWVYNKLNKVEQSEETIEDKMKELLGSQYSRVIQHTEERITNLILKELLKEEVNSQLISFVVEKIEKELHFSPSTLLGQDIYKEIKEKLLHKVGEYGKSDAFIEGIQQILYNKLQNLKQENKTLQEIIPVTITGEVKVFIYNKRYHIAMTLKELLKEEKVRQKLREVLSHTISSNVNPMIAMFLSVDSIYEKVIKGINHFLDQEENQKEIAIMLHDQMDKVLNKEVGEILAEIPEEHQKRHLQSVVVLIKEHILNDKTIDTVYEHIETQVKAYGSVAEVLQSLQIDYNTILENFLKKKLRGFLESSEAQVQIKQFISVSMQRVQALPMNTLLAQDKEEISQVIVRIVQELYNKFIQKQATEVVEVLNVTKIVEDKINEFDVSFAEKLILDIANKELKAITWLGALLGGVIGLLSPIIGSL